MAKLNIIVFLLISNLAIAQQYASIKFTLRDGLPQSQVLGIAQDKAGYIWFSTKGGISRFDGKAFENFGFEHGYHTDLYSQIIFQNDSTIFLGVHRGVAQWFHLNQDTFTNYHSETVRGGKIIQAPDGKLLLTNIKHANEMGHLVYEITPDSITLFQDFQFLKQHISRINNWCSYPADSSIWMYSNEGKLLKIKDNRLDLSYDLSNSENRTSFHFHKNQHNELFAFYPENNSIYKLDDSLKLYRQLPNKGQFKLQFGTGSFALDDYGNIFIVDKSSKVWAFFHNSDDWTLIDQFNYVRSIFLDNENNLYVPDEGALHVYKNFAFSHYSPEKDKIPKYIWSIVEDDSAQLWLGSWGHGLKVWDFEKFHDLSDAALKKDSSSALQEIYMGAIKDQWENVLIPTGSGVYVFLPDKKLIQYVECEWASVLYLYEDVEKQIIYAGTTNGVYAIDSNYNVVDHIYDSKLMRRPVVSIEKDNDGNLWMGTYESIVFYDGKELKGGFKGEDGKHLTAKCIQKDGFGNIWFGSHQGLYVWADNSFIEVSIPLFKNTVQFIKLLSKNQLLVGLRDGLVLLDLVKYFNNESNCYQFFGEEEGFIGIEPGQNGAFIRPDGKAWITTTDKLSFFDPDLLKAPSDKKIKMNVQSLQVMNSNEKWKDFYTPEKTTFTQENIEVPYSHSRLRFDFKAIHHTSPNALQYTYRLKGYDKEWSPYQNERFAEFTNLPQGNYVFQIRAKNKNEADPTEWPEAQISFHIPTPFYLEWWFFLAVFFAGSGMVSYGTVLIARRIRKRKERDVKLRLELNQLQYKALKAQVEPHFASNLLNSVNAAILKEDKHRASKILSNFARLIRDILVYNDRLVYTLKEELDFIQRYIDLEKNILKEKLEYIVEVDEGVDLKRKIPVMLLHTFVENAVKHAILKSITGGTIKVNVSKSGDQLDILISDTGSKPGKRTLYQASTKKGISLIEHIVKLYNQRNENPMHIHIEDQKEGRKVQIIIPDNYVFEQERVKS